MESGAADPPARPQDRGRAATAGSSDGIILQPLWRLPGATKARLGAGGSSAAPGASPQRLASSGRSEGGQQEACPGGGGSTSRCGWSAEAHERPDYYQAAGSWRRAGLQQEQQQHSHVSRSEVGSWRAPGASRPQPGERSLPRERADGSSCAGGAQRAQQLPIVAGCERSPRGRLPFVPIKSWSSCWEVAEQMSALPAERLDQKLLSAALQHMANVHAAQPRGEWDRQAFARLLRLCIDLPLARFDPQGLTIVVRTAARMGCRLPPPALEAWARAAVARLPEFKGQDIANSLYSLGRLEQQLPPLALRDFADAAIQRCHGMPPLELSPTLLGLAYMGCLPRDVAHVAEAFLDEACGRLGQFSPQELANLLWAFSKLTEWPSWQRCGGLLLRVLDVVEARAPEFLPEELAALLQAQAAMGFFHPGALAALVEAALDSLPMLEGRHLANILAALALLPHPDATPCADCDEREGGDRAVPALPAATHVTKQQVAALREEVEVRLERCVRLPRESQLSVQALCNAVWGLAALQDCTPSLWHAAMAVLEGNLECDLTIEGLIQLYHSWQLLQVDHPEWGLCLPGELAASAAIAWEEIIDVQVSAAQREVSVLLEEAGIAHELEHRTEGSMRSIDCALPHLKLAIEVDGPHHFTVNRVQGAFWLLGRTLVRDRLLQAEGWHVLSVPLHHWQLLTGREERRSWLLRRVECARAKLA